jgi:hypothetical protein
MRRSEAPSWTSNSGLRMCPLTRRYCDELWMMEDFDTAHRVAAVVAEIGIDRIVDKWPA